MLKDLYYKKGKVFFPYILYLPEGYSPKKKYPFVLQLHGAGERGENFEHYRIALPKMLKNGYSPDAVIVCPQCAKDWTWNMQIPYLHQFLLDMMKKYHADESRVYITGLSMGGYGTWEMIVDYPELFAAAGPICGGGLAWRCDRPKMPIRAYHGLADTVVDPVYSRLMVDAVQKNGGTAELIELPGVNHNSWDYAYETDHLIEWLLSHTK